jgi:Bardet-Biedl syndrome 1 protein
LHPLLLLHHSCWWCVSQHLPSVNAAHQHFSLHVQVWKGTQKVSEVDLQNVPVAVCALLLDSSGPRTPTVAVAAGSHVYMFQNLRSFYKFTLPAADAHPAEEAVW